MTIRLGKGDNSDPRCPYCDKNFYVDDWDTEYGDPSAGDFDVHCPSCHKDFWIRVYVNVEIFPSVKQNKY